MTFFVFPMKINKKMVDKKFPHLAIENKEEMNEKLYERSNPHE
jgi:hypothetical protein